MSTLSNSVDLKEVADANPTSKALFEHLSARIRHRNLIDIPRTRAQLLKEGKPVVNDDLIEAFRKMEAAGLGAFRKRGGFEPFYNVKQIGKSGLEGAPLERVTKVQETSYNKGRPRGSKNKKTQALSPVVRSIEVSKENPLTLQIIIEIPKLALQEGQHFVIAKK